MRDSDESLLKSFATTRDEAAFRALAERYFGLIFHTALRRTENRPLAEEVSQNILSALAKKAGSLAKNPDLLPAWLHRATLYESSKAMRSESSHQRRKQLLHPDAIPPTAGQESSPWSDALPHLDVVLDKLPDTDRRILMLHYFEKRSFPTIARLLGKNPAAIQKQAQRAMEKLCRLLRTRGVALSVTAVAAGLTSEFAKAAPVAFLQSATKAVLNGSTAYSTTGLTLMTISKSKALIPFALLCCAMPLALQQIAISKIQSRTDDLRAAQRLVDHSRSASRTVSMAERKSGISTNTDVLVLFDEQKEVRRQGPLFIEAFDKKLAGLENETLVKLIRECAVLRENRVSKAHLLDSLVGALAGKDARLAVTTSYGLMTADKATSHVFGYIKNLPDYFSAWAGKDIGGAKEWLEGIEKSVTSPLLGALEAEFRGRLVSTMIADQSSGLHEYLLTRPEIERSSLVKESIFGLCRLGGESAAAGCAASIPVVREFVTEQDRDETLLKIAGNLGGGWRNGDPYSTTVLFFEKADLTPAEQTTVARAKVGLLLGNISNPYDPVADARALVLAEGFLRKVIPEHADQILEAEKARLRQAESRDAEKKIKELQENSELSPNQIVAELTRHNLRSQLPAALKIAERLADPFQRAYTIDVLNKRK